MTSTTAPPPQQQHAEDTTILFGSTPHVVFDEFGERVDNALAEGVSSLPLLPKTLNDDDDKSGDKVLMKLLRKAYLRNVDVAEGYACRNIFSIQNLPPTRRNQIVQAFLSDENLPKVRSSASNGNTKDDNDNSYRYPTKDEIPSQETLQTVQKEIEELRDKLRESKRRRNRLLGTLEGLASTDDSCKTTSQVLADSTNTKSFRQVHDSVTATIVGKEGLDKLVKDGTDLSDQLDQVKRQRAGNDDAALTVLEPPPKKLTLEEQYEQDRKDTRTGTKDIEDFQKLLKKE